MTSLPSACGSLVKGWNATQASLPSAGIRHSHVISLSSPPILGSGPRPSRKQKTAKAVFDSSQKPGAIPKRSSQLKTATVPPPGTQSATAKPSSSAAAVDTFSEDLLGDWEEVPVHTVTVHDRFRGVTYQLDVPQDQYILHTAEEQGIRLPFACRHGCCTACAVRVLSGELAQPRALGISPELKAKGYALMCVGVPLTDLEVETQDEDEVYYQQFGKYFARGPIERDDYALELAMQDE